MRLSFLFILLLPVEIFGLQLPLKWKALTAVGYGAYSIAVDIITKRTLKRMQAVDAELSGISNVEDMEDDIPLWTPSELKTTVSKRSLCVTDPVHRRAWHKWRITKSNSNDSPPLELGSTYEYFYRSYCNFEERDTLAASLGNWKLFLLFHTESTKLYVVDEFDDNTAEITLVDKFRLGLIVPVTVKWHGKVFYETDDNGISLGKIVWNKTMAKFGPKTVENPPVAEKLSTENWDIVKSEDDMVCLQRGDIGYLMFGKMV